MEASTEEGVSFERAGAAAINRKKNKILSQSQINVQHHEENFRHLPSTSIRSRAEHHLQQNSDVHSGFEFTESKANVRMILSTSSSRSGIKMGSSPGYPGYPSPPGVPGLGLPPPVPSLTEYRNAQQPQYLMSHHMHSLPTPQPQPLGKFQSYEKYNNVC